MTSLFSSPRIKAAATGALALTMLGALIPEDAEARRRRGVQRSNDNGTFTIFEVDDTLGEEGIDALVIFEGDQISGSDEALFTNGNLSLSEILASLSESPGESFLGLASDSSSDGDVSIGSSPVSADSVVDTPLVINGETINQFFVYESNFSGGDSSGGFTLRLFAPDFSGDGIGLGDVTDAPISYLASLPSGDEIIPGELTGMSSFFDFDLLDDGNGTKFGVDGQSAPFTIVDVNEVPEPVSVAGLLVLGALGVGSVTRRKAQIN